MTDNGHVLSRITRDELLCQFEMRRTEWELTVEQLQNRHRNLEATVRRFTELYRHSPIAFVAFDQLGRIVDLNPAATRLLEITASVAVGKPFTSIVGDKTAVDVLSHLRRARSSSAEAVSTEIVLVTGSSRRVPAQIFTCPVKLESGRLYESALIDLSEQKAAAESVRKVSEYAQRIVSTIPYPVLVLDARGRVFSANAAFLQLFETSEREVVTWPICELPAIQWQTSGIEPLLMKALSKGAAVEESIVRAESRRGEKLILEMTARRFSTRTDPGPYLLVAFEDITRRHRDEEERKLLFAELEESRMELEARVQERTQQLATSYAQLRALGEQLVLAHESEQRRIALELHDQVGQDLTALKMVLSRAEREKVQDIPQVVSEAKALTEELLQTVRNICSTLRPQVLDDLGLIAGLAWHFKTLGARTGLDVRFEHDGFEEGRLSPLIKSVIFRVIQEALTNVTRHAQTKEAVVMISMTKNNVEFSIRDNGRGFDPAEVLKKNSTGLSSMRERVTLALGKFEITSSRDQGTNLMARIPILIPVQTENRTSNSETHHGESFAK
jgi:PAS domain S-box-containing protein